MTREEVIIAALIAATLCWQTACTAEEVALGEAEMEPPNVNGPQKAVIMMPSEDNYTQGQDVRFAGIVVGKDAEKAKFEYRWISSVDGQIGKGLSFASRNLSAGQHAIEFQAVKTDGTALTASKTVRIIKAQLAARIISEKAEGFYMDDEQVNMQAGASGGYPPYSYAWKFDGSPAGVEASVSQTFAAGEHAAELVAKDSSGATASATWKFVVSKQSDAKYQPLSAEIISPKNGELISEASLISFEAGVSGGRPPYAYLWLADETRTLASSAKFTAENLINGSRKISRITLKVADADGRTASDTVSVTSKESCKKDGMCYPGETYLNCPEDCKGWKEGNCDALADGKCDPDCERGQDPDCACNKNGQCETAYENAESCPQDCPTGSADKTCDAAKDSRCDPDCPKGADPDCGGSDWMNYLLLLALAGVVAFVYAKFIRNR